MTLIFTECDPTTVAQLIEFLDALDDRDAAVFGVEHARLGYTGTVRSELNILLNGGISLHDVDELDDLKNARNWLSELWNRADAVGLALDDTSLGLKAIKLREMSLYLGNGIGEMLNEVANGNDDLALEYYSLITST